MDAMGGRIFPWTNLASGPKNRDLVDIHRDNVIFARRFPRNADIGKYGLHRPKSSIERETDPNLAWNPANIRRARTFTSFIAEPRMP